MSRNSDEIAELKQALNESDAVVIGAGSGLSTAAGYTYSGERFDTYFFDFRDRYGFRDMYSGGFYPFPTMEEFWGFWSRNIWINRYAPIPNDTYDYLYQLVKDKDYFVITTNVDHCFQRSGFSKNRLFYTQGDYGLLQDHDGKEPFTYDNEAVMRDLVLSLEFEIAKDNTLIVPDRSRIRMRVPEDLVPYDFAGKPMTTNLRIDSTFVEDEGWHRASERYSEFLRRHRNTKVLFLELGVGMNTPGIIKIPFLKMTQTWPDAVYACVNNEAFTIDELKERSICISGDIRETLHLLGREA